MQPSHCPLPELSHRPTPELRPSYTPTRPGARRPPPILLSLWTRLLYGSHVSGTPRRPVVTGLPPRGGVFEVRPCQSRCHNLLPFQGRTIFHGLSVPHSVCPSSVDGRLSRFSLPLVLEALTKENILPGFRGGRRSMCERNPGCVLTPRRLISTGALMLLGFRARCSWCFRGRGGR